MRAASASTDGREIRLAGIEPVSPDAAKRTAALSAFIAGRDVTLRGDDDAPDRYGRQTAFVFVAGEENSVQAALLSQGEAFAAADIADKGCAAALLAAEAAGARSEKGHLGRSLGHKKRGKYGRYLGREWALYAGGRQGSVSPAGRGNDLPQLRPQLDTGFLCDYLTAHVTVSRGGRHGA